MSGCVKKRSQINNEGWKFIVTMKLDSTNFDTVLATKDTPVLVDFWATWCGPCRMVAPVIEQLANDYEGKAIIGKLDVDQCGDIAMRYGVMSIPTVIVFKNGQIVGQQVGATSKGAYAAMLDKAL